MKGQSLDNRFARRILVSNLRWRLFKFLFPDVLRLLEVVQFSEERYAELYYRLWVS